MKTVFVLFGLVDIVLGILMVLFGASALGLDPQMALIAGLFLVVMGFGPIAIAMFVLSKKE